MVPLSSGFNPSTLTHPLPSLAGKVGMGGCRKIYWAAALCSWCTRAADFCIMLTKPLYTRAEVFY